MMGTFFQVGRFGGTYRPNLQSRSIGQATNQQKLAAAEPKIRTLAACIQLAYKFKCYACKLRNEFFSII
jgi:hypothetical protein